MATRRFDPYNDPDPDEMEWLIYKKDPTKTPFDVWLKSNLPSIIRNDQGYGWVCVCNKSENQNAGKKLNKDLAGLFKSWKLHLESNKPVNYEIVKNLAKRYHILTGKWILFTDQGGKVDHLWSLIASSIIKDDIPCFSAKVSTHVDEHNHVICIYNTDFTNTEEVLAAEEAIRHMGIKGRLQYKPDVFSYLMIYARNEWGLKPYTMTSQFNLLTRSSIIENVV